MITILFSALELKPIAHLALGLTITRKLIKFAWDSTSLFSLIYQFKHAFWVLTHMLRKKRKQFSVTHSFLGPAIIPSHETVVLYIQCVTSEGSDAIAYLEPSPFVKKNIILTFSTPVTTIVVFSSILSPTFLELSQKL